MGVGALPPREQEPHDDEEEDGSFTHHETTSTPIPPQAPIAQPMPIVYKKMIKSLIMIIFKNNIITKSKNNKVQSLMMNLNKCNMRNKIFHHTLMIHMLRMWTMDMKLNLVKLLPPSCLVWPVVLMLTKYSPAYRKVGSLVNI